MKLINHITWSIFVSFIVMSVNMQFVIEAHLVSFYSVCNVLSI